MVNYRHSIEKGLLIIMSKMGISTFTSYHGSMLLHSIGLGEKLSYVINYKVQAEVHFESFH